MNEFLNKLSLYDILTTIVLGGCVMFALDLSGLTLFYYDIESSTMKRLYEKVSSSGYFLVGCCYLLGLITHKIAEAIDFSILFHWSKKNSNKSRLIYEYRSKNKLYKWIHKKYIHMCIWRRKWACKKIYNLLRLLVDVIFSPFYRNKLSIIKRSKEYAEEVYLNQLPQTSDKTLLDIYYTAYYRLADIDKLFNIPKIEAHSAFLKDLICVLILFIVPISIKMGWCVVFIGIGIILLLSWCRYYSEFKIHYLVWEGCVQYLRPCCCKQNSIAQPQPPCPCGKLPNCKHYGRLKCPYCTQDFSKNTCPCSDCKCERN